MTDTPLVHPDKVLNQFENRITYELKEAEKLLSKYKFRRNAGILLNETQNKIDKSKKALTAIEAKTYGICQVSGELIPVGDLVINPLRTTKFCYIPGLSQQKIEIVHHSTKVWKSQFQNAG